MQRQIDDMAQHNIIEPSNCLDWNVPLFLVDKKDGRKRVIADLRKTNMAIAPRVVVLPNIADLLTEIQSQCPAYYTSYDLFQGYYQIFLRENSRDMTTFTAPSGLRYRFVRAPMGLTVSPAAMLTVLTHVLGRLRHSRQAYLYMDDAISAGRDFSELLGSMRKVFQTFRQNNLKCNPKNCNFGATSVQYLGFELTKERLKISEDKIKIIKALKPPTDKKTLQRQLGLLNFFRKFIKNYSQKTVNLRKLLRGNEKYVWNDACQKEFDYLKGALISEPILVALDSQRDFVIVCDAAKTGLGWSILQRQDLHALSYGGMATTEAQQKWTAA